MKQITLQIDSDIAERIEFASNTLGIDPGELLSDFLLCYTGKPTRRIPGVNAEEIFNSIGDPLHTFKHLLREIKKELEAKPEAKTSGFEIQLTANEKQALEFFASYDNKTPEEYVKNWILTNFEASIECIDMEKCKQSENGNNHWKNWLSGRTRRDLI